MLIDANLLIYAINRQASQHEIASRWLSGLLDAPQRVGIPWQSVIAFLRISTHARINRNPLTPTQAWGHVEHWLDSSSVWIPTPGAAHGRILAELYGRYEVHSDLVNDAILVALAIEHGLTICSADTDFARFAEIEWHNPVAPESGSARTQSP